MEKTGPKVGLTGRPEPPPGLLGHQRLGYLGLGGAGGAMKGQSANNTPWRGLPPDRLGVDGPGPQNLL